MIHYTVNNKIIYNRYLAEYESYQSGQDIRLYFYDDLYDQYDWTVEPEESFETLMDRHAVALRLKYDKLILSWSGGTDSHTIYNVFARNRIHLDEIHTKYFPDRWYMTSEHADWLYKNHWDPTTKITAVDLSKFTRPNDVYLNEDWLFTDMTNNMRFTWSSPSSPIWSEVKNNQYGHQNYAIIQGHERPFIQEVNGRWYYSAPDTIVNTTKGLPPYENFFLEPLINIKQTHMMKRAYKKLKAAGSLRDWNIDDRINYGPTAYRAHSKLFGRHDEVVHGSSHTQKAISKDIMQSVINPTKNAKDIFVANGHGDPRLLDGISRGDQQALGYARGIANLASDVGFYQHLNQRAFTSPDHVFSLKKINSKPRYIGD